MKNERKPKTTRIAAHPAKKNKQVPAPPNEKGNGKQARGSGMSDHAEDYLERSSLPEQNPNPVMRFTSEGQPLFGNPAAISLLDFSADQPTMEEWRALVISSVESGANCEAEIEHNDRTFSALFVPVQEAGYVNVYCRDVTAHKQTQDALRRSEERFRQAADASSSLVYEVDLVSGATAIVHGIERVAGYGPQEIVAASDWWHSLIHPNDLPGHLSQLNELLQQGDRDVCEYRLLHKNGDWIHVQDHRLVIRDDTGQAIRLIGAVRDISTRKAAEQERIQLLKREQEQHQRAQQAWTVAEEAKIRAERELWERQQAESALGAWADQPLPQQTRPAWLRYGMALVVTGLVVAIRQLLDPLLGETVQYSLVLGSIAFSIWYGGLGPALVALVVGYVGITWLVLDWQHIVTPTVTGITSLGIFLFSSVIVMALGMAVGRAQRHARQNAGMAVKRQQQAEIRLAEQQRAERELRESEQRFRKIFETVGVSVWVEDFTEVKAAIDELQARGVKDFRAYFTANPDFVRRAIDMVRVIDVNQETLDLYGASSKDELLGSLRRIFIPETESAFFEELVTLAEGREIFRSETQAQTLDGRPFSFIFTIHFSPQANDYSRVIVTITDITERKQMEQSLRASEEKYRRIVETANEGIWEIDTDTCTTFVNQHMAEMLGYTVDEMMGKSSLDFVFPEDNAEGIRRMEHARDGMQRASNEFRFRRKDGSALWALISRSPKLDAQGNFAGSVAMVADITERKQIEQSLARERELFKRLFDTMPVMSSIYEPETATMRLNAELERLSGWKAEEVTVASLLQSLYPDPDYLKEILGRMAAAASTREWVEAKMQTRDGRTLETLWANISIIDDGQLVTGISLGIDITERKRMEDALRDSQLQLTQELVDTKQLQVISSQLIQEDNIDAMYEKIVRAAMALMRSDMGSLQMLYPEKNQLHLLNAQGFDPASAKFWEWVHVDSSSTCGLALQTGERVIVHDVETSEFMAGSKDLNFSRLSNIRAVQSTPLISREGQIVGMISTHWREPYQPLERELQLLDVLARQAADLIERKLSEAELTEYARQQAALFRLAEQLQHSHEPDEIYDAVLDAILEGLQCNRASILLFDETERMRFVAWRGLSDVYRQATDGHSPWTLDEKKPQPIYIHQIDTADFSNDLKAAIKAEGIGSLAFIPLVSNGRLIGKFMVYFDEQHAFGNTERDLGLTIARQLAFALDRQWAEEKLRISEDRLRLAVGAGNIGIWDIDLRSRDRIWSKEGKAIYGLGPDEFLDYPRQLELTHPDDRELVDKMVTAFRDQGSIKQLNLEHRVQHSDGSIHWVEVHGEAIYEDEPQPVRLIGTILDITERKKAEESLKQSEERFRQFMEHLPGLAWIKDKQGRYVYANAAAQKAFRTPDQILYGKRDSEVFSADVASQFMKNDERALTEGGVQVIETLEHEDGVHHSLVTKFPIPGLEEDVEIIGGIAIDITERRRAEEALRHSEERMRLAIESNRMVAWEWDPVADQVMTSANITEVYGMSEVGGAAQAFALIWPEDLPAHQEKIDRVMNQGGEYHSEFRITRPVDGKVMWMEEWASALRDDSGRVTRLVGIVTDITGRKQGEDALRQAREQAEATADRMARLQEITAALVRSVTPTELAELILEQGTRASGASAGILVEVTNEQNLKTLSALGYPKEAVRWEPVPLSESTPVSDCVLDGQAVWISSHEEFAAQYPSLAEFRRGLGNEAAAALPLIVGDQVIGALAFSFIEERDFLLEERGFLLAVAQQCAQAIERVRASEALRESEERYRFIVESTSDGIWQIDLKEPMPLTLSEEEQVEWYYRHAVIRQCNLELARMYGYDSVAPVIGLPMSVVMPFETNAELSRQFIRANYRLVDAESREKNKDGRDLVFLNNMIGIIKDGKLIGEWGTNRDITQRRRAEEGLTLLAEISELTRDAEDPLALMAAVSDTLGRHFQVKRCLFNEIDVEDDLEVVHHDYHDGVESVQGIHKLTEYSNITTTEMMEGNTIVNFDSRTDPRTAEQYERSYMQNRERAYVAVPLMRDDQWVASLWLSTDTPRQWMDDEITMLETVAERTWTAVEKLRINAALRDSEERLRVTFNTTAVGFATLTPDTRFVDVNQAFCSIVGYSREELLTMNFDYLTHPNYVKSTRDHMGQLLSGEVSSFVIEKLYLRKDGTEVWVQNSVSLVRDVDEHPLHLIVISQDITERKRIEEELLQLNLQLEERVEKRTRELQAASELQRMALAERRQAQDRFAKSFNASPAAMTITRFEDGMYRNVNPRFIELLEYNLEDVIGHTSLELNIYRTPQERIDLLKTIRNNKGRWDYETQLQTRSGKHLDVTISVVEIELDGEPHILSMITDVTERNQMLTALRASEQQLRTLFDVLPVGVSYVSSDGQVIESNRTLEKIIDITRDELNDGVHRTRQYIRADGTPMPLSEFASTRAMAEQRTIKNVETGIIKEGGQVIWTSVSATPISMPEPGVVVITVDVTERKHMDDELRRSHRRYQILSQRLVEIQEEERRTISRELHDRVGQSLAALNLNLNFMNQTIPANTPPPIKTRIKDAIQLTEETVSTIRDVMADLRPPALDDYGLEAALNAYADTFSRRFGIRVDLVKPAAPLPRFNSNIELTLLRIAQEALTNVAKHSHASKASIRLTLQKDAVHLSVEDNGEGIRSWQKANRPGSHGLKIMRERAETFGGTLQVQSFNQKGTKIEVKIPMQDNQPKIRAEAD